MKAQVAESRTIKNVVVTRSTKGNADLAGKLRARGFDPVSIDTIEFLPPEDWSGVDACLMGLREFDWLLFTSPTGVGFFSRRMKELSLAFPRDGKPAVAAVGQKTAAALRREGVEAAFVPSEYLTKALAAQLPRDRGKDLLVLRADIGEPELVAGLERDGFRTRDLTIYRTLPVTKGEDKATEPSLRDADAILFASPSAVEAFMGRLGPPLADSLLAKGILAVCIGPVTAKAARAHGFERILTAKTHTIEGLLESLSGAAAVGEEKEVA